tara:strand:- start:46 stop:432 length:387 start_codon:yes stop_codon:yes gene_type:complete
MKHLLVEILDHILGLDKDLAYEITCDGEDLVALTRDTSLACNQKDGDKYEGIDAVDEGRIEILKMVETKEIPDLDDCHIEGDHEYVGFIYWTNFNDGVERVSDYSCRLDDEYGLNRITNKWEKDYERL